MIRAAIDPGSRWIAVTVTRDDGPGSPCTFLDAHCFEVGRTVHYDPPLTRYRRPKVDADGVTLPAESYAVDHEHVATAEDRRAAADAIAAYLIAWKVEACDVENVEGVFAKTAQAASAAAKAMIAAAKTVERALTLWEVWCKSVGIVAAFVMMLATTWRARLVPMVKAIMVREGRPIKGVLIRGKGSALEPVLCEHVPGWPGGATWSAEEVEHIRDSTGLALACGLPALPARVKGAAGPRLRRERGKSKAHPRGSRARAKMGEIDRAKHAATTRAYQIRTVEAPRREALVAIGCVCKAPGAPGRHKATCAAHKAKRQGTPAG